MHIPSDDIYERSLNVLENSRVKGFPVPDLLEFNGSMFNWDLAVMAEALAYENPRQAANDIRLFLHYQAPDGNLGNDVSIGRSNTFARSVVHRSKDATYEVDGHTVSRVTQPALIIGAALEVGKQFGAYEERDEFYRDVFLPFKRYVRFLLEERTDEDGLIVNLHAYETGMDDTPPWAETMYAKWAHEPEYLKRTGNVVRVGVHLGRRVLGDGVRLPLAHRATNNNVLLNFMQSQRLAKAGYDLEQAKQDPRITLINDVGFNAIADYAFASLREIADEINDPSYAIEPSLLEKMAAHHRALHAELWDESAQTYFSKNARTGQLIPIQTIASLFPLLADAPHDHQEAMVDDFSNSRKFNLDCPAVAMDSPYFESAYWRGGIWPFARIAISKGLQMSGFSDEREMFEREVLLRPGEPVKGEFDHPKTKEALGTPGFGPMAAQDILFIQHLKQR